MAKDMNLSNVTFVPSRPRSEIPDYLSICDIALVHLKNHPAFKSVIPSKIFEAMAMGIPILLALPDGEASSLIKNTGSGYWLNPQNTSQFCEAVNYLYNNPDQLIEFGKAGREASFQFARESSANEMISVFNIAKTSGINKNDPHGNMG